MNESKLELFLRGKIAVRKFVDVNNLIPITVVEESVYDRFGCCAYYRNDQITIDVKACAGIGKAGRAWSYPGYVTDRTPFGVMAHELDHHVDMAHGSKPGLISREMYHSTKEEAISGYSPNVNEWFAEIFRLFVTNPNLLLHIRPKMYQKLMDRYLPIETRAWDEVIDAERQRNAARNKIAQVQK
jgi:hypothetical protein